MAKFCGNCGQSAEDNEQFCSGCGAPLSGTGQTVTPVPVEQPQSESAADEVQPEVQSNPYGSFTQQPVSGSYDQQANTYDQQANNFTAPAFNNGGAEASVKGGGKKALPLIIAAVAVVVVIVAVIVIRALTRFEKIDAKELFDIEFAGPDGYGMCYAQLDINPYFAEEEYDVYMEDYSVSVLKEDYEKIKYSKYFSDKGSDLTKAYKKASDKGDAKDMRDALLKTNKKSGEFKLTCKPSKKSGLKNGDKITVKVDYDEDYLKDNNIKLTNTEFEVEVKGLQKAVEFDPFDGFEPAFDGNDGSGTVDYSYYSDKYDFVSYSLENYDDNYSLSNGDKAKFSASLGIYNYEYIDEKDKSKGFWFTYDDKCYVWPYEDSSVTKEFTVEGLKELTEIDPFENIEFDYSYAAPYLKIYGAKLPEDSEIADYISYSVDDSYDSRYKIGDKFTLKCYAYYSLADAGYKLKGEPDSDGYITKEYTVDDTFPSFASSASTTGDFTSVDEFYEKLADDYKDGISGSYLSGGASLDSSVQSVKSMKLIGQYVVNPEGFAEGNISDGTYNYYGRLYELDLKLKEGTTKAYVFIYASNVYCYNGEVYTSSGELLSEKSSYYFSNLSAVKKNDIIKTLKENGEVTELAEGPASAPADETTSSAADTSSVDDNASSAADSAADSSSAADDSSDDSIVP